MCRANTKALRASSGFSKTKSIYRPSHSLTEKPKEARMRNRTLTALAAVAFASLVACSTVATLGTDSNTALKELTAVRQTRDRLYASKDLAGLSKYHARNLTAKLADGTRLDRAGYEAFLQKKMEAGVAARARITQLSQEETGFVAVVEGQGVAVRETWKRTGDGWKLKSVREMSEGSAIATKKNERKRAS